MFVPVKKWTWSFDNNVSETRIYPYVSNGMKKVVERESGCMFFREKLNGEQYGKHQYYRYSQRISLGDILSNVGNRRRFLRQYGLYKRI